MSVHYWAPVKDVARLAGVSLPTLQRWVVEGRLTVRRHRPMPMHVDLREVVQLLETRGKGGRLARTPHTEVISREDGVFAPSGQD